MFVPREIFFKNTYLMVQRCEKFENHSEDRGIRKEVFSCTKASQEKPHFLKIIWLINIEREYHPNAWTALSTQKAIQFSYVYRIYYIYYCYIVTVSTNVYLWTESFSWLCVVNLRRTCSNRTFWSSEVPVILCHSPSVDLLWWAQKKLIK